jgi:hypothetical protein
MFVFAVIYLEAFEGDALENILVTDLLSNRLTPWPIEPLEKAMRMRRSTRTSNSNFGVSRTFML